MDTGENVERFELDTKSDNRFVQFELWKACRNGCSFCFNKGLPDIASKSESIDFAIGKIRGGELSKFNEIGFIGGEFFDNQLDDTEVKRKFYELFELCSSEIQLGKFKKMYVTTSFIYESPKNVLEFMDFLKSSGTLKYTLFCTSYDTVGRFCSDEKKVFWESNMKLVKSMFPDVRLHTEIIMTQDFIDRVLDGRFDIARFKEEFSTSVDYLEPNTGSYYRGKEEFNSSVPGFLPKRKDFLKFLKKTCEDGSVEIFKLFSKKIRSDMIYLILNGKHVEICGRRNGPRLLGIHLPILPKFGYVDSEVDIADDVEQFRRIYGK